MSAPRKVLVVEDNLANQKVACYLLRTIGLECDIAGTGTEGLQRLSTEDYCMVLLDIFLPELNGFDITDRVRSGAIGRNQDVAIIAVTACSLEEDRERCLEAGMTDYLSKPYTKAQLIEVVERWCTGTRARGSAAG